MAAQKYYEGQEFHNPNDPSAPVLVYRGGKFIPQTADLAGQSNRLTAPEQATLKDARSAADNSINVLSTLAQFQDANGRRDTGGLAGAGAWLTQAFDPNVQRMQGLTATLAPSKRPEGSGTTSDKDLALYLKGTPDIMKGRNVNDQFIEDGRREGVRRQQKADFLDQYARQYGTLNGAEQAFRSKVGQGSKESPLTAQEAGDRSQIPRGAYYMDPQGNMRRNDNGARGNPIIRRSGMTEPKSANPQRGQIVDGYRYNGGPPGNPASWSKQ